MKKITDRELLAFCSLAKLKLEFSEYKKVKVNEDNSETEEYKTIHQLLDQEIEGQHNRKNLRLEDVLTEKYEKELTQAQKDLKRLEEEKKVYDEHLEKIKELEENLKNAKDKIPKVEYSSSIDDKLSEAENLQKWYKSKAISAYHPLEDETISFEMSRYIKYLSPLKNGGISLPTDYGMELKFLNAQLERFTSLLNQEKSRRDILPDKNYIKEMNEKIEQWKFTT